MDLLNDINFLPKPRLEPNKLTYIQSSKTLYVNLFELRIRKEIRIFCYPYTVYPQIEDGDIIMRRELFKACQRNLYSIYGLCFISGNVLYGLKKVDEPKIIQVRLLPKGKFDYTIEVKNIVNERIIRNQDIQKDPLAKQIIELIVRDIIISNPQIDVYNDIFFKSNDTKLICTRNNSILLYQGFYTSYMEIEKGNYLNVSIKTKLQQKDTILDYLNENQYRKYGNEKEIKDNLIGKSFKVSYLKKNQRIDDILFDRSPANQTINYENKTINLFYYYEKAHKIMIKDINQPLILVKKKDSHGQIYNSYFIPELCYLCELDDDITKDLKGMKEINNYTKFIAQKRIEKNLEFLKLSCSSEKKDFDHILSSKEKFVEFGIEIMTPKELFTCYYMNETKIIAGDNKIICPNDRIFPILEKMDMTKWLCFYEKSFYNEASNFYNTLSKASIAYGLKISEPEWIELPNSTTSQDWVNKANIFFQKNNDYSFVIFLIIKRDSLYKELKQHSLYKVGYISQVVKTPKGKKYLSICSKILLQINSKLGGISYKIDFDKNIIDKKLMIIGINSSHIKNTRTGVAMVATINDSFTEFFNKEEIIQEKNKKQLYFNINSFIDEAIEVYKRENNNEIPKGIIIYRQGVSLEQKNFLKDEIKQIDFTCFSKKILYYYILVNKKKNFKFFIKSQKYFTNPGSCLLVIDGITNRNFFEFYLQPQEVTEGSAVPICYHVAYGNLNCPEIIPKLTFDLCNLYCNWQGKVRIPNVLKAAEKLSKITAKYMPEGMNSNLRLGQIYL